jgi:REP element-mobilizing transposase RayT
MPQSLVQLYVHLVFSTKLREPCLRDGELRGRLHAYLAGACRNLDSPSLIVGGVEDHVHILCRLSKTGSVADLIRELKRESSKVTQGGAAKRG